MRPSFPVPKDIYGPPAASTGRKKVLYLLSDEDDLRSFGYRRGVLHTPPKNYHVLPEISTLYSGDTI
jgi:hypothetical protein